MPNDTVCDAIYLLGGSPYSLMLKFIAVAGIYHMGKVKKILIMDHPGITVYDKNMGRNLTNNEWALKKITQLGVRKKDIEIIKMDSGFFGTLTEAYHISRLAKERHYKNLVIITAPSHTKRSELSFRKYLNKTVNLFVQSSSENFSFRNILIERIKLFVYLNFLTK